MRPCRCRKRSDYPQEEENPVENNQHAHIFVYLLFVVPGSSVETIVVVAILAAQEPANDAAYRGRGDGGEDQDECELHFLSSCLGKAERVAAQP